MLERAKFTVGKGKKEIPVMFNPESYSVESGVQYTESSAILNGTGIVQFQKISPKVMSLDLYFDTLNGPPLPMEDISPQIPLQGSMLFMKLEDVSAYTKKFYSMIKLDSGKMPIVTFNWGNYSFEGVVTKISEKYTMFRPDGAPVRATLSVSITEYSEKMEAALTKAAELEAVKSVASSAVADVTEKQKEAAKAVAKALV